VRAVDVIRETETVVSLQLAALDGQPLPAALPGQFIVLRLGLGDRQPPAARSYSLSGRPGSSGYRVSVKREPHGVFSTFVHSTIHPGAVLEISAPRGRFTLAKASAPVPPVRPVLLLSAGIGATPVLAMLHALAESDSPPQVWWLHGARNSVEHAFAAESRVLLARLANARSEICFSSPLPADTLGKDYTHRGRLDARFLEDLGIPADAEAYVCGPQRFMDDVRAALTRAGLTDAHIHSEVFGAGPSITPGIAAGPAVPPHQPAGRPGGGPGVTFSRIGLSAPWREDFGSVLELAEACDVPVRWSCRTGVCHTCVTGLLAGSVHYDPPPLDLPADGQVLVCCAVPDADVVLDL
jgi:ferredoxin-NADP reductase